MQLTHSSLGRGIEINDFIVGLSCFFVLLWKIFEVLEAFVKTF